MTEQQKKRIDEKWIDLERYMQAYRTTLVWLTHGNPKALSPTEKEEQRQLLKQLQEKIIALLTEIEQETHFV